MAMSFRLTVDPIRCEGHGICVLMFPDRVDLDEWGFPVVGPEPFDEKHLVRRAKRAVAACPKQALVISTARQR